MSTGRSLRDGLAGAEALEPPSRLHPSDSIPSAVAATCETCHGTGKWSTDWGGPYDCSSCRLPAQEDVELAFSRLSKAQRRSLIFGAITLAAQPVTPAQWDEFVCCRFYVKAGWRDIWFASSHAHLEHGKIQSLSFRYNALGIVLRQRLEALAEGSDSDGAATAAANGDLPVPKHHQARREAIARKDHP